MNMRMAKVESKSVDELRDVEFDFVVTLCDNAAQTCPLWLGPGRVKHMGFPDPAAATGSEAERQEVFRQVRDDLRQKVLDYLEQMQNLAAEGSFYGTRNL